MKINFNGQEMTSSENCTLYNLLTQLEIDPQRRGLALCLNLEVLPRGEWSSTTLSANDRIDLVIAAPGG